MPRRNPNRPTCPPDHAHALTCYGSHRCGCDRCRRVNAAYARWLRKVRAEGRGTGGQDVPSVGTVRRVRALNRVGWSTPVIFERARLSKRGRDRLHGERVTLRTASAIRRVYDELAAQRPPETDVRERISVTRTRRAAERAGWAPPDAWWYADIDDPDATPDVLPVAA